MAREHWFFIGGVLVVVVPLLLAAVVKKFDLLEVRPDRKESYAKLNGNDLKLHIFHAKKSGANTPAPALILFHGGGWRFGSPQQFYPQCQFFAQRGITCISAEVRLGPSHLPDIAGAIGDAGDALDYLRSNARKLGIDENRIYAGGGSSGGHLAAALGLGLHGEGRPRPAALALYNPVLDLSPCAPAHYLAGDNWEKISPLHQMNSKLPPTLILTGSEDPEVTPQMVNAFCTAARELGGTCDNVEYAGQHHGFFNDHKGENPFFNKTNEEVIGFLQKH
jgi:acetyl esterase/lipase